MRAFIRALLSWFGELSDVGIGVRAKVRWIEDPLKRIISPSLIIFHKLLRIVETVSLVDPDISVPRHLAELSLGNLRIPSSDCYRCRVDPRTTLRTTDILNLVYDVDKHRNLLERKPQESTQSYLPRVGLLNAILREQRETSGTGIHLQKRPGRG
jgi:hypothetical protein